MAAKPRERVSATRVLLQAARLNLDALEVAAGGEYADVLEELRALRGDLGRAQLGEGPAGDPEAEGGGGGPGPGG